VKQFWTNQTQYLISMIWFYWPFWNLYSISIILSFANRFYLTFRQSKDLTKEAHKNNSILIIKLSLCQTKRIDFRSSTILSLIYLFFWLIHLSLLQSNLWGPDIVLLYQSCLLGVWVFMTIVWPFFLIVRIALVADTSTSSLTDSTCSDKSYIFS
jgi:hypothetical protein